MSDPDQEYKSCLIYQAMYKALRWNGINNQLQKNFYLSYGLNKEDHINNAPFFSFYDLIPHLYFFTSSIFDDSWPNAVCSIAARGKPYRVEKIGDFGVWDWQKVYGCVIYDKNYNPDAHANIYKNGAYGIAVPGKNGNTTTDTDGIVKDMFSTVISKQAENLANNDATINNTSIAVDQLPSSWDMSNLQWDSILAANQQSNPLYMFKSSIFNNYTDFSDVSTAADNALADPSNLDLNRSFYKSLEKFLGYSPNLTLFNNYLDMGQLLNNQGNPTFKGSGNMRVYNPNSPDQTAKGDLETTTNININGGNFGEVIGKALSQLKSSSGISNGITSVFTSGDALENWAKSAQQGESGLAYSKTISWQGFVNKVLAAAAPDLSGDNNKQMYVPGSGYYNTDNRGFLLIIAVLKFGTYLIIIKHF